jgi:hypothetical protein
VKITTKLQKMTSVAKEKSEICHISFTFPITVANENFNLAGPLGVHIGRFRCLDFDQKHYIMLMISTVMTVLSSNCSFQPPSQKRNQKKVKANLILGKFSIPFPGQASQLHVFHTVIRCKEYRMSPN